MARALVEDDVDDTTGFFYDEQMAKWNKCEKSLICGTIVLPHHLPIPLCLYNTYSLCCKCGAIWDTFRCECFYK